MSKRWKLIRSMLSSVGYTTIASAADITINSIDAEGYITYTDENGDQVKALYNTSTPIVVDSDTATLSITIDVTVVSGTTQTLVVLNENLLDVTAEITFGTSSAGVITTGGTYGELLTHVITGTSIISYTHDDWDVSTNALASGTTTVTVVSGLT